VGASLPFPDVVNQSINLGGNVIQKNSGSVTINSAITLSGGRYILGAGRYDRRDVVKTLTLGATATLRIIPRDGLCSPSDQFALFTYTDAEGRESKPSPAHEEVTVDNFKEK
jgi:hypothetical protein